MERKTKVEAASGKQTIDITRNFELPVELLFQAYTEPGIIAQWMGTNVLKHENKNHGSWHFQTRDQEGNIVFEANGVIHEFVSNQRIIRTFQMTNTDFPVQLDFLEFESIDSQNSKITIHTIYKTIEDRDQVLKLPFAYGINMAHNRLQEVVNSLNEKA